MSKISKTAAASMRGGPTEKKVDPFDTNEKKIKELRVQRLNKLAVIRYDFIDALIEEYDKSEKYVKGLKEMHMNEGLENGIRKKEIARLEGDIQVLKLQLAAAQK